MQLQLQFQHGNLAISHKTYYTAYTLCHLEYLLEIEVAQNIFGINYGVGVRRNLPKIKALPSQNPAALRRDTPCRLVIGLDKKELWGDHVVKGGFCTVNKGCDIIHETTAGAAPRLQFIFRLYNEEDSKGKRINGTHSKIKRLMHRYNYQQCTNRCNDSEEEDDDDDNNNDEEDGDMDNHNEREDDNDELLAEDTRFHLIPNDPAFAHLTRAQKGYYWTTSRDEIEGDTSMECHRYNYHLTTCTFQIVDIKRCLDAE